jgi:hypothetical protein
VLSTGVAAVHLDNATYHVTLPETAAVFAPFARVSVSSSASDDVANVRYFLTTSTTTFRIDSRTGEISLNESLDFESGVILYNMTVAITPSSVDDPAAVRAVLADIFVHVTDVNDNAPHVRVEYADGRQVAVVAENVPPRVAVADVIAYDADSGRNGHVVCSLQPTTLTAELFALRPDAFNNTVQRDEVGYFRYHVVTATTFDRERRESYDVTVTCSDAADVADSRVTSTVVVRVFIGDVNDNRPIVSRVLSEVRVVENNAVGTRLTVINATDADAGENATLRFLVTSVAPETDETVIVVDSATGVMTAEISFDYEKQQNYDVSVRVCDRGSLCAEDDVIVRVTVVDVNDERPVFERTGYRFSVVENRPEGARIGKSINIVTIREAGYHLVYEFARCTF